MRLIETMPDDSNNNTHILGVELNCPTEADLLLENLAMYMDVMQHNPASKNLKDAAKQIYENIARDQVFVTQEDATDSYSVRTSTQAQAFVLETVVGACNRLESNNPILLQIIKDDMRRNRYN